MGLISLNCHVFEWKFIRCFCRELFEESSLKSDDLKEIGLIDFEFVGDPQILEVHVFTTSKFEGEPTESSGIILHCMFKDL